MEVCETLRLKPGKTPCYIQELIYFSFFSLKHYFYGLKRYFFGLKQYFYGILFSNVSLKSSLFIHLKFVETEFH